MSHTAGHLTSGRQVKTFQAILGEMASAYKLLISAIEEHNLDKAISISSHLAGLRTSLTVPAKKEIDEKYRAIGSLYSLTRGTTPWPLVLDIKTTLKEAKEELKILDQAASRESSEPKNPVSLEDTLENLRGKLANEYPPYHWNHLNVFSAYWNLVDQIKKK